MISKNKNGKNVGGIQTEEKKLSAANDVDEENDDGDD